jgi:hypothetical protein
LIVASGWMVYLNIFIYLFTDQFVLTAVWLCKVMLEDQYNNTGYESVIPYYGTEGVWCENFSKSDNELLIHASTNEYTILNIVCFPGNLLLNVSVQSSFSGSLHQCCLNLQQYNNFTITTHIKCTDCS